MKRTLLLILFLALSALPLVAKTQSGGTKLSLNPAASLETGASALELRCAFLWFFCEAVPVVEPDKTQSGGTKLNRDPCDGGALTPACIKKLAPVQAPTIVDCP